MHSSLGLLLPCMLMLNDMGYGTGIDTDALITAARLEKELLGEGNFSGHLMNIASPQCLAEY